VRTVQTNAKKEELMQGFWTKAALGAAAIVCAGAVQASNVIDFEHVDLSGAPFAPLMSNGDFLQQNGFFIGGFDGLTTDPSLVGALVNGADAGCLDGACPTGNTSTFYASLNTGGVFIGNSAGIQLTSFQAAFVAPASGVPSGAFGLLAVEADRADGSYAIGAYGLAGPGANGSTAFGTYLASDAIYGLFSGSTGTNSSGNDDHLQIVEYNTTSASQGSCKLDSSNLGQFALDNVTSVPEPSSWFLMAVGLGALGIAARRRRAA
jgi:hypothetical protein